MTNKIQLCIYCLKKIADTKNHIPPQSIFDKPLPKNLISVPSCFECNNSASTDDEYFRIVITIGKETSFLDQSKKNME